jgi:hypothetical protein
MSMRLKALVLAAAIVGVLALPATSASAPASKARLHTCGKIADLSGPSKVSAANMPCGRALNVAAKFVQDDRVAEGWKPVNPAGCEWLMFKKSDKRAFRKWFFHDGPLDFKLIGFTKERGCVS